MVAVLALVALLVVRYSMALTDGKAYTTAVRSAILDNPMATDADLRGRIETAATKAQVELDPASVRIERGGSVGVGAAGTVSGVHLRYSVPWHFLFFSWKMAFDEEVKP